MFVSKKELTNLKLSGIKNDGLKDLCDKCNVKSGNSAENIKSLIEIDQQVLDSFIKTKYKTQIAERQNLISDDDLKRELLKVNHFKWGIVQGQLDQKIQTKYVRRFFRFNDLVQGVKNQLQDDVLGYVIATWYNHWTTVLIEDYISQHPRVIPTLKNNFGVDIFFDDQPFDLKITYLPKNYSLDNAIQNPKELIVWLYENQGAQRFGDDNRFYVVLASKNNIEESWKLKRDFDFIFSKLDKFFDTAKVTKDDEIVFIYKGKSHTTVSKLLLITK